MGRFCEFNPLMLQGRWIMMPFDRRESDGVLSVDGRWLTMSGYHERINEARTWCETNTVSRWTQGQHGYRVVFGFRNPSDAMLFKLVHL